MVSGITVIVSPVFVLLRLVMVVVMVIMAGLIIGVGVHKGSREGTHWRRKSHTQGGRKRKQPDHCPDQGNAPSASSLHARQHDVTSFCCPIDPRGRGPSKAYPLDPFRMLYHNLRWSVVSDQFPLRDLSKRPTTLEFLRISDARSHFGTDQHCRDSLSAYQS